MPYKDKGYQRKYYIRNREERLECRRQYRKNNAESVRRYGKKWREKNPDYGLEYYKNNREKILKRSNEWAKNNRRIRREYKQEYFEWRERLIYKRNLDPAKIF